MKRSPMPQRKRGIAPRSKQRDRKTTEHEMVRALVFDRDRHRCQVAVVGAATAYDVGDCFGILTPHHVRKASQGGAYTLENLVSVCAHHNDEMEADADLARWARSVGLVRKRGD